MEKTEEDAVPWEMVQTTRADTTGENTQSAMTRLKRPRNRWIAPLSDSCSESLEPDSFLEMTRTDLRRHSLPLCLTREAPLCRTGQG